MKRNPLIVTMALFSAMAWADGLPEGYTQLPFLKATGNCQVKTGLTPASTDTAALTFELSTVSGNQNLWCSRNDSTASFTVFMIADKVRLDRNTTQVTSAAGLAVGTKYTLTANYGTGEGEVRTVAPDASVTTITGLGTGEYDPGTELCLFASHTTSVDTGLNNYGSWTFYSFKLYDVDDNLRCDLVPARRNSDGVLGLYDTVRDVFLTNGLAGTLTLGTGYSFDENGALLVDVAAQVQGSGTVSVGGGGAAAAVQTTVRQDGSTSVTFTAVADEGCRFSRWVLPEGANLTQGELTSTTISVSADRPVTIVAGFYSETAEVCAKLVNGTFHYYADASCSPASELPPDAAPSSIAGLRVFFANDDEYQALVPYTNELATALGGTASLQNDITLTADTDWRAIDFDLNGKVIVLKGYDLYVHKPQGEGRITAGNLVANGDFEDGTTGWTCTGGSVNTSADGDGVGSKNKNKPFTGNHWCILHTSNSSTKGIKQTISMPKTRNCYIRFRYSAYSGSSYTQYVYCGIDSWNNVVNKITTSNSSAGASTGVYTKNLTAGSHEIRFSRTNGISIIDEATVSPESHLVFDIPEGEEHNPSNLTLGSTQDYFFDGMGLQIHKTGKGKLVMSKACTRIGGYGATANIVCMVVDEGVVENTNDRGCGPYAARIEVKDGAQFNTFGAAGSNSAYYDFTLSGSGPDGLGAVVNNTEVSAAYDKAFIMRNVTLSTNAVIGGTQNFSLKNGNWTATTMTLGGHTITYSNNTVYAGNMSYSGGGNVVIPEGVRYAFYAHNSAAADCDVIIEGAAEFNGGGFTSAKSLVFETGSTCLLSDAAGSGSIPTTIITGTYAPPAVISNGGECTLTNPKVQLGDASHLEPTLDLSRLGGVYDGTNTTFYAGSTVTVDLGEREFQGSVLLIAWTEISSATFVVDDANKERLGLLPRPEGLYIFPGKVPSFVKYDVANDRWAYYDEDVNLFNGEWTLGMDYMKALFANDAEFQGLAQHKNDLEAANVTVHLQSDVTLTADADWSTIDFDMNGKTIYLMGWDLKVHKPQGVGRITAGNLITNGGFENGSTGWVFGSTYERVTSNGYGVSANTCKDRPFAGNHWCVIGAPNDTAGATTMFPVARTGVCYIRFRYAKYDSNYEAYGVDCGIDSPNNVVKRLDVKPYPQGTSSPIYQKTLNAGTHSFIFGRYYAHILVDEAAVSPESHLTFDIPEGEEYELSNISLGSTEDYFFDGIGLQVHKTGKGQLTMSKVNNKFGGSGVTSMVVKEGLVKKVSGATCGAPYSRIVVEDGAQFDLNGRTYHDYDYTLAGSGSDGTGALISSVAMDAATAYAQNTGTSFLRHVALSSNATVYAANNMGMIFYNYNANTMTMNGHTVTYDGVEAVDGEGNGTGVGAYRTFLGNMSYSGAGKIVVATNGWIQSHISSPTATDTDIEVYGRFWMNTGRLTPVKSLVFKEGSLFRELNANPGVIVVNGTYGPNVLTESAEGYLTHPKVQLGDASHLNATLDLSQWTTTFDDTAEGSLSFYAGTTEAPAEMTVTVEISDRTVGLGGYALLWKDQPAETVQFVRSENMRRRGIHVLADDDGIRFKTGLSIHIR